MKALAAALLILALPADAQITAIPLSMDCADRDGESVCIVPEAMVDRILQTNNRNVMLLAGAMKRIEELEAKLAANPPKCAETTITEPSKNPAPKPLPRIKREADS